MACPLCGEPHRLSKCPKWIIGSKLFVERPAEQTWNTSNPMRACEEIPPMVPGAGLEPAHLAAGDFESLEISSIGAAWRDETFHKPP